MVIELKYHISSAKYVFSPAASNIYFPSDIARNFDRLELVNLRKFSNRRSVEKWITFNSLVPGDAHWGYKGLLKLTPSHHRNPFWHIISGVQMRVISLWVFNIPIIWIMLQKYTFKSIAIYLREQCDNHRVRNDREYLPTMATKIS